MRHCSVQVHSLLTKEERERYQALIEAGQYLEQQQRHDLAYPVQKEIDRLILPAIERLKEKGRKRDRETVEDLQEQNELKHSEESED